MTDATLGEAVEAALREFGEASGLDLGLDADGTITIDYAGDVRLTLEVAPDGDQLVAYGPVGPLPPGDAEAVLVRAMQRNVFRMSAAGLWLGLDASSPDILLCGHLSAADVSADALAALLLAMIAEVGETRAALFGAGHDDPRLRPGETPGTILFRA